MIHVHEGAGPSLVFRRLLASPYLLSSFLVRASSYALEMNRSPSLRTLPRTSIYLNFLSSLFASPSSSCVSACPLAVVPLGQASGSLPESKSAFTNSLSSTPHTFHKLVGCRTQDVVLYQADKSCGQAVPREQSSSRTQHWSVLLVLRKAMECRPPPISFRWPEALV